MKKFIPSHYDIQGLAFGIVMTSLGVVFLKACGLVTGQLAGLSVLLSIVSPLGFSFWFFIINLPFYYLSWKKKGAGFTVRTMIAVIGISLLTPYLASIIEFHELPPLIGAVLAGCCSGVGLIALFRHKASAGGIGILAIYLQERFDMRAGWVQMSLDALIFIAASFVLTPASLLYSCIGALVMNMLIAWNFRLPSKE